MQLASSREMEGGGGAGRGGGEGSGMDAILSELHGHGRHSQSQSESQKGHFDESQSSQHDDFLEQMFSTIPNCSWPPQDHLSTSDPNPNPYSKTTNSDSPTDNPDASGSGPTASGFHYPFESLASSKLRLDHQQINQMNGAGAAKSLLQQQLLLSHEALRSPCSDSGLLQLPLSLGGADSIDSHLRSHTHDVVDPSPFKSLDPQGEGDASVQAMYNKFVGTFLGNGQNPNQPQQQDFHHHPPQGGTMPGQNYGAQAAMMNQAQALAPPASASTGGSSGMGTGAGAPQRQRVRARRGQATDPHSIAERLRRERIAERMKALQELVPNGNKTDKASMLDEIIDYVKFLQLQVKVLSMSRLGGAGAVAPLVANMSTEGGGGGVGTITSTTINGNQTTASTNESNSMTMTEHQVAKLMEEDMGSAMQYLQGKGLCLMPISLATAISTATCRNPPLPPTRPQIINQANNTNTITNSNTTIITNSLHQLTGTAPSLSNANVNVGEASPSSVQSATLANGSSTDHPNP